MNEINPDSMDSLSELIDAQLNEFKAGFNPGEQVTGTVAEIGPDVVVVDLHAKQEGVLPRSEFDEADLSPRPDVGDELTAYFVDMRDGAFQLSLSLAGAAAYQGIREAVEKNMPVEGLVKAEINGGYEITVGGERAFCPYSQIDLRRKEPDEVIGRKLEFLVTEFDPEEKNIVLSHREFQERERQAAREELRQSLAVGDHRDGVVCRIAEFGVFVDLGGMDGLVPLRELTWDRKAKPEDVVSEGEHVQVVVREIDWEQERITLSLRYAAGDPWDGVGVKYPVGTTLQGTVTKLAPYGAFVELEPGVEGLVHVSKLGGGRRIQHAREVVSEGQELEVEVESVDLERQRIGLKPVDVRLRKLGGGNRVAEGLHVTGIVDGHREFGVFVKLNDKQTGLLHISETRLPRGGNPLSKLENAFPPDSEIEVVVKSLDGDRISLTLPEMWKEQQAEAETDVQSYIQRGRTSQGLGSLGDAFDGLKLPGA